MLPSSVAAVPYVVESKPATEWIEGAPVRKVSPRYAHSLLQGKLCATLAAWARGRGRVGPEWRFWLTPPGELARYLVPDIAYLSYERLPREERAAAEEPRMAPDVAIEIRSSEDRPARIAHKVDVYLRSGAALVALVDPATRTVTLHDATGVRILRPGDRLIHSALPGLDLDLAEFFAELDV